MVFSASGAQGGAGIGGALSGIAGGIAGLLIKGGTDEFKKAAKLLEQLQAPEFEWSDLAGPQYRFIAEYMPEVYEAVVPDEVKLTQDSSVREAQMRGLEHLERAAKEGLPVAERVAALDQQRRMAQEAQRTQGAIRRDLATRGRMGGGSEIAQRAIGAQQQAELARGSGADLARMAAENRLGYAGQAAQLGGQIRGQDVDVSRQRAAEQNRFNELIAQLRTGAAQYGAGARERAQFAREGGRQRISEAQEQARYQSQLQNQMGRQQFEQAEFANKLAKLQGQSGVLQALGTQKDLEKQAKVNAIGGIAGGIGSIGGAAVGGLI